MDNSEGLWFTDYELHSVSDDDLQRYKSVSEQDGCKYFVQFRKVDVQPVYKFAWKSATRKRLYTSQYTILEENVQLFNEVILRRDINARMLGYASLALSGLTSEWPRLQNGFMPFWTTCKICCTYWVERR